MLVQLFRFGKLLSDKIMTSYSLLIYQRDVNIHYPAHFPQIYVKEGGGILINLFIYYIWLRWVFVAARGLSLVAASRGYFLLGCVGFLLLWLVLLRSTGSRRTGSVVVAHGPSCSAACGILPDQGSNPCPLNCQADSQPLCHQGSPGGGILIPFYRAKKWGMRTVPIYFPYGRI